MKERVVIELAAEALLQLPAAGTEINCVDGALWITQDHCGVDIVLQAGERYLTRRSGTLLQAMPFARLTVARAEKRSTTWTWALSLT